MSIKITPTSLIVRGYDDNIDLTKDISELVGTSYRFICSINIFNSEAYIYGALGNLTLSDRKSISKQLLEDYNIKQAHWIREKLKKVTK